MPYMRTGKSAFCDFRELEYLGTMGRHWRIARLFAVFSALGIAACFSGGSGSHNGGGAGSASGGTSSGGTSSTGGTSSAGTSSGGTAGGLATGGAGGDGTAGSAGTGGSAGGAGGVGTVDRRWAQWPMPSPGNNPTTYDTGVAGVVTDTMTGLMWQQAVDSQSYVWSAAKTYCNDLTLAGYDDWRLPTRIELVSLIDVTRANPSIDTVAFPSTPNAFFWSSSPMVNDSTLAWTVYFGYGGTGQSAVDLAGVKVRCVR